MTITHHASDALLMNYAAGRLSAAPSLVLESHLAMSRQSAKRLVDFEGLGGVLLEEEPLVDVSGDLFERMLSRLDDAGTSIPAARTLNYDASTLGFDIPEPLSRREIGGWRWIAPGMRFAKVEVPEDPGFNVVLLRVGAGKSLPMHGHAGTELTLVLKGSFRDEEGRYGVGDLEEEDGDTNHQPKVEMGSECICLAAIEGSMRPHGWFARMLQPFIGI